VIDFDVRFTVKIGDGAGYLQDAVVGPGRQAELVDGAFNLSRSNGELCSK
jgi:hypothetical protein